MTAPTATALFACDDDLFVCCPLCDTIHRHKASTTPRLIETPAVCDEGKTYIITPTMKPKNVLAALNLYHYEAKRKQEQYRRRKGKAPTDSEGSD